MESSILCPIVIEVGKPTLLGVREFSREMGEFCVRYDGG